MNTITGLPERHPANLLAIDRTILANERTLLSFLRTFLGFFIAGTGLLKYVDHPVTDTIGAIFIVIAAGFMIWGIMRYRYVKKILGAIAREVRQAEENDSNP
jgi:putative membrane protein